MKIQSARYAVTRFNELKSELGLLIEQMGIAALTAVVRLSGTPAEDGWGFYEIGVVDSDPPSPDGGVFWGKFREKRGPQDRVKDILIILDLADVGSIELEVYDDELPKETP